jgi:YVTN family beta-propeller protein
MMAPEHWSAVLGRGHGRGRRRPTGWLAGGAIALALTLGLGGAAIAAGPTGGFGTATVGPQTGSTVLLPTNQQVAPVGTRFIVGADTDSRLLSSTVSPDGTKLAALSWHEFTGFLSIIDLSTGKVIQTVGNSKPYLASDESVGADGPLYSPDGTSLWVPTATAVVRFTVDATTGMVSKPVTISLPTTGSGGAALPSGMALSADGTRLYVAFNGYNTLGVIDTATNALVTQIGVGNAPRQVVVVGTTAYVSNEGGTPCGQPSYCYTYENLSDNTPVIADPTTGAATTGTVSVVDLTKGAVTQEISVGLEPSAEYLAPDGTTLLVANSNADSVSLIDTTTKSVVQTVNTNPVPGTTVGSGPNAILMPDASHLLVSLGRDNALAAYSYSGPTAPVSYLGLLPTDWYPVAIATDATAGQLVVTNDKGIGARGAESTISKGPDTTPATGHNTYNDTGSLTEFSWSAALADLGTYTHDVVLDNGWEHLGPTTPAHSVHVAPVAIPLELGQPSTIQHVFLIDRENRTYDQVFGDVSTGNGDPSLAQFGATYTPNAHALALRFGLFDNFYDPSTLSADGHNWLLQANANDYLEKEFGAFWRSYPALGADALAYQSDGFLWNMAAAAGKTVQDFGEYANFQNLPLTGYPTWSQWYKDAQILQHQASGPLPVPESKYTSWSDLQSVNAIIDPLFPTFDLDIPDQYRVDVWQQAFAQSEKTGKLANLTLIALPDDHTAGLSSGDPYPVAEVADNDLALGRIVDTISHSPFWKSSAIFVVEDDSQNGVDHVDGHRAPALVISPWAQESAVNDTYATQLNLVKTIEQILGLAPMNQMDRAAVPMYTAFTSKPDFRPYTAVPNKVPLTLGIKASASMVPAGMTTLYQQWVTWSANQHFGGSAPAPDVANPAQLNRLDWYAAHGWTVPYPGDPAILAPDQVPGANSGADH